jgi:hypothetical protein
VPHRLEHLAVLAEVALQGEDAHRLRAWNLDIGHAERSPGAGRGSRTATEGCVERRMLDGNGSAKTLRNLFPV